MKKIDPRTLLRHITLIAILLTIGIGSVQSSQTQRQSRKAPSNQISEFITLGNNVGTLHEARVKNDLWRSYKLRDMFELDYLYTFCNKNWGEVAYLLALEGTTKISATDLLATRVVCGNWSKTSVHLKVTNSRLIPYYKLEVYLDRQRAVWNKILNDSQYIK